MVHTNLYTNLYTNPKRKGFSNGELTSHSPRLTSIIYSAVSSKTCMMNCSTIYYMKSTYIIYFVLYHDYNDDIITYQANEDINSNTPQKGIFPLAEATVIKCCSANRLENVDRKKII